MFVPVIGEYRTFDFGSLMAAGTQERIVGQYINSSGVRSGTLVVRANNININAYAGAKIEVFVRAAWQDSVGALAIDAYAPRLVATILLNNSANTTTAVLIRSDFQGPIPTPGLIVTVVGTMGSSTGSLTADLSIAVELLPT